MVYACGCDLVDFQKAIEELRENTRKLEKQWRMKNLWRILRFLLIGFLFHRDFDKRISELVARNDLLLKSILRRFEDYEALRRHKREAGGSIGYSELADERQFVADLTAFKEVLSSLMASKAIVSSALLGTAVLRDYEQTVLNLATDFVNHRKGEIHERIKEIEDSGTYLVHDDEERVIGLLKAFGEELSVLEAKNVLGKECVSAIKNELEKHRQYVLSYNREFVERRKKEYGFLFVKDGLSLDEEQKEAVVKDDKHNLVVAAAGSGKTEVLITRVAYLIKRKPDGVQPNRILAIAFQDKARREIEQRLRSRYGIGDVNVKTFHKLGKDILEKAGWRIKHTDIVDENKFEMVKKIYESKLKSEPDFYDAFLRYVRSFRDVEDKADFEDKERALRYKKMLRYVAINGVHVKSRAEKEILDFFLMHKLNGKTVKVEYEPDIDGFRPDFWLSEFDLFVEHWALDKNWNVPEWFGQSSEYYKNNMRRKKEWFDKNSKLLVETFAYEYDDENSDRFVDLLKQRVIERLQSKYVENFEFSRLSYDEVVEVAWGPYRDPVANDVLNFIRNAKTYGLAPDRVEEKLHNGVWSRKQLAFGELAVRVFRDYEAELRRLGKIDFEDMINKAIDELRRDKSLCADVYDHILVDEYQDISAQRYKLIRLLLDRNPKCKLFCVGDDWQSIMGFAGSNVYFFINFDRYFENPAVTKISTNYRSVKSIVDAGASIIKNNGVSQISKPTVSYRDEIREIKVLRSTHKKDFESRYHEQTAEDCLSRIKSYLDNGCAPSDVLVLSRYKFPRVLELFVEKAKEMGLSVAFDKEHAKENQIRVMTVHKSKGLQAKAVFLLDVVCGAYGFPCEIEDPSILAPARENYPPFDHKQEERRLFYVAVTRAKEDLFIYTWEPAKSEFLEEISKHVNEEPLYY